MPKRYRYAISIKLKNEQHLFDFKCVDYMCREDQNGYVFRNAFNEDEKLDDDWLYVNRDEVVLIHIIDLFESGENK